MPHRFADIKCIKKTALFVDEHPLHANKVALGGLEFVASQSPVTTGLNYFWKAIFDGSYTIFDLTNDGDLFKKDQCGGLSYYYPTEMNQPYEVGGFKITLISSDGPWKKYEILDTETLQTKEIWRLHFKDWPDQGVVSVEQLDYLVNELEKCGSLWIHCRAGVGRTGTAIAAYLLKQKIKNGEITKDNLKKSLVNLILEIRKQRADSIQALEQFILLVDYGEMLLGS